METMKILFLERIKPVSATKKTNERTPALDVERTRSSNPKQANKTQNSVFSASGLLPFLYRTAAIQRVNNTMGSSMTNMPASELWCPAKPLKLIRKPGFQALIGYFKIREIAQEKITNKLAGNR